MALPQPMLLATICLVLTFPQLILGVRCFTCKDCSEAPSNTTTKLQSDRCSACYKIIMWTSSGSQVVRSCGDFSCKASMTFRREMRELGIVTNANGGSQPDDWKAYCCGGNLCNHSTLNVPSSFLLILLVYCSMLLLNHSFDLFPPFEGDSTPSSVANIEESSSHFSSSSTKRRSRFDRNDFSSRDLLRTYPSPERCARNCKRNV